MAFIPNGESSKELSDALYNALAVNAKPLSPARSRSKRGCPLMAPVIFQDGHIDKNLQLKYIRHVPLDVWVAQTIHVILESFKNRGISLPCEDFFPYAAPTYKQRIIDAYSVGVSYENTMASILPGAGAGTCTAYTGAFGLEPSWASDTPDEVAMLDPNIRPVFQRPIDVRLVLAWWEVFTLSEETDALLKAIGGNDSGPFDHKHSQTSGFTPPPICTHSLPTADGTTMPWGEPLPVESSDHNEEQKRPMRRSLRLNGKKSAPIISLKPKLDGIDASWPDVTIAEDQDARPLADRYTLRAWARAVERDTTFVIFYNGKYERIGLRHRASQTLFLSPVIDTVNRQRPFEAHIEAGLYLSIIYDAANRLAEKSKKGAGKRRRDDNDEGTGRRYKTRAVNARERNVAEEKTKASKAIKRHAIGRSLVLLEMRYGIWNSPAPSAFVRTGTVPQKTYNSSEYMSLVLTSKVGDGATGVAYTGRLEILVADQVYSLEVVVKLAFKEKQVRRLRHEHTIYEHLESQGVKEGIPYNFGLFEDAESQAAALIMSHEGTNIFRKPASEIPEDTKSSFIRILDQIHQSGIRHRDIRRQNLTLGNNNKPAIIDFDRAKLEPTEMEKKDAEMSHMKNIMRGLDDNPKLSASTASKQPSSSASDYEASDDEEDGQEDDEDGQEDDEYGQEDDEYGPEDEAASDNDDPDNDRNSTGTVTQHAWWRNGTTSDRASAKSGDSNGTAESLEPPPIARLRDEVADEPD